MKSEISLPPYFSIPPHHHLHIHPVEHSLWDYEINCDSHPPKGISENKSEKFMKKPLGPVWLEFECWSMHLGPNTEIIIGDKGWPFWPTTLMFMLHMGENAEAHYEDSREADKVGHEPPKLHSAWEKCVQKSVLNSYNQAVNASHFSGMKYIPFLCCLNGFVLLMAVTGVCENALIDPPPPPGPTTASLDNSDLLDDK